MPLPLDRYRCGGCGQLLTFDSAVRVPTEQLRACQGRCDWLLIERFGAQVVPDPGAVAPHPLITPAVTS